MLRFNDGNSGQTAQIPLGDDFEIALTENPSTGFRWKVNSDGAPVCTREGDEFEPGVGIGAAGTHHWRFHAAQAGECSIAMALERSWTGPAGETNSFALRVVVGS